MNGMIMSADKVYLLRLFFSGSEKHMLLRVVGVILLFFLYVQFTENVRAQENQVYVTPSTSFVFYFQNRSTILERAYMNNGLEVDKMNTFLRKNKEDLISNRSHLEIVTYIMPEDIHSYSSINSASIQASVVRAYVKVKHLIVHRHCSFVFDTASYFRNRVQIAYVKAPVPVNRNRAIFYTLKQNDCDSVAYAASLYDPLPLNGLLNVQLCELKKSEPDSAVIEKKEFVISQQQQPVSETKDSVTLQPLVASVVKEKKILFSFLSVKTNFFYWGGITPEFKWNGIIPNAELEWYYGNRWSLNVDVAYAYFEKNNVSKELWGLSSFSLEPRIWLSDSGLYHGFYGGVYGLTGDFDVKLNHLSTDGHTGAFKEVGISLGYYLPLTDHWGIEAGMRGGYRMIDCDRYIYQDPYFYYQSTSSQNGIKLTGMRLSIVYRFNKSSKY